MSAEPGGFRPRRRDLRQQVAAVVLRREIDQELVERRLVAHAGEGFAILRRALAPERVGDAGLRHQVAFVAGVDEHGRGELAAVLGGDRGDGRAVLAHAVLLAQPLPLEDGDAGGAQHLAEDRFRDVRLVQPRDVVAVARHLVMHADAPVELERVAADHFLVAVVGPAEAARDHAAQMRCGLDQRGLEPWRAALTAAITPPAVPP